ncbi:hypothetical protein OG455_09890 [Kitasatospora sp. NBC_01287]|uniref:hypothetical protein n=1 Tax=Kitasatospora sp. NBC_01287 TaxID=2903573 RepID=UPI00225021FA|nr:hypothetical protein [Kitasatospora sp. NBC_01287]MCX4745831.1 hypothetical protein [Kitasatospora sp. NBC_01287]
MSAPTTPVNSAITWEEALTTMVGAGRSDLPLVDRHQAAATGTYNWMSSHNVIQQASDSIDKDSLSPIFSLWWVSSGPISDGNYVVVGAVGNWDEWDRDKANSKYLHFDLNPGPLLDVLRNAPHQNDYVSQPSFFAASDMIAKLGNWIPELQGTIKGWTDKIDVADSDLQGSAAGKFKEYLESYSKDLGDLWFSVCNFNPPAVGTQSNLENMLEAAGTALVTAAQALWDAWNNWRMAPDGLAYPAGCLTQALAALLSSGVTVGTGSNGTPTYSSNNVDITTDSFWHTVEDNGKQVWLDHLVNALDVPAKNAMGALALALSNVDAALSTISPETPGVSQPTPPGQTPPGGDDGKTPPGGDTGQTPPGGDTGKTPPGGDTTHLPPPPSHVNGGGGNSYTPPGAGGGSTVPLLDKDGKPVTGKDGKPLTAPAGSTIGANGEVFGPDGKPVLGPDGKPEYVPKGGKLGAPSSSTTSGSAPFSVPPGSTLNADGTVNGPDGKLLLDAGGNPVYLGKKATIGKDGKVLDSNGKPISQQAQYLADEEHALDQASINPPVTGGGYTGGGYTGGGYTGGGYTGSGYTGEGSDWPGTGSFNSTSSSSGYTGESFEPDLGTGSGDFSLGGGIPSGPGAPTVGGTLLQGTTGYADRSLAQSGQFPTGAAGTSEVPGEEVAGEAAAGEAAEEAQMMGRSVSTTGGSGMPMMPGAGMGGMGGQQQGNQERQRTTWLAEDEEVWGTESGAVGGVIGR